MTTPIDLRTVKCIEQQGLRYVSDHEPGFYRKKRGKKFIYLDSKNKIVKDPKILERFQKLVIPPAWSNVWISRYSNGHIQVTGRDLRGRKQYKYHPDWVTYRNQNKFDRLFDFGQSLQKIRLRIQQDLKPPGLSRRKVLAAAIQMMDLCHIRVGNEIYTRQNKSYGLSTLRNHHAHVSGARIHLRFRGKSGVQREITFSDLRLSRIIRRCQELPGQDLFGYQDKDGRVYDVGSSDINDYLKEIAGSNVTAKDFRTWGGTVKALETLLEMGFIEKSSKASEKKRELEVIRKVAAHLGNTVAVCRKYYVAPLVFEADRSKKLHRLKKSPRISRMNSRRKARGYSEHEHLLLSLMKKTS